MKRARVPISWEHPFIKSIPHRKARFRGMWNLHAEQETPPQAQEFDEQAYLEEPPRVSGYDG